MRAEVIDAVGTRAGLVVVYGAATAVGRASVVDGDPMALVWPAGGLAAAWMLTRSSVREWLVDLPLLVAVGVAGTLVSGLGAVTTTVLAVSNLVAVLTVVLVLRWWRSTTVGTGGPPTASPRDMMIFLAAVVLGALLGVTAGALGYLSFGRDVSATGLVVWFGRNVCGMAAVGVTSLLVIERLQRRKTGWPERRSSVATGRWPELTLLFVATASLIVADRLTVLPVSFLLPAAAVWAGSRFDALAVALHALLGGGGVLWLTYVGHGPFAELDNARLNILLAQLFVAMTLTIGLVLASAREARAALSQELTTFARRAAHDLRNPLSVVESWTGELAAALASAPAGAPPEASRMIAGIEQATARMRALIHGLLADAAAGDRAPTRVDVDLPELVAEVAAGYGASDRVRTIGVAGVAGDPVLLRQLFDNLVGNALKYVAPERPPEITVCGHRTRDRVLVRVIDNGIGIPAAAREWIFEPFRRAHEDGYPGTGLGLTTCRRIVGRHGGSLRALPREDGPGSVFELDLPPASAASSPTATAEPAATRRNR